MRFLAIFHILLATSMAYAVPSVGRSAYAQEQSGLTSETGAATKLQIIPAVFIGKNELGDYFWMRNQPGYERAYFIFNDNEEQFLAHQQDPRSADGCSPGGGNAAVRSWQCETPPRAGGVPTGSDADLGYQALTPKVKAIIDRAVVAIEACVRQYEFDKVIYSSCVRGISPNCTLDDDLGTGIFHPSEEVRSYIVSKLKQISP
jgi:hypothetical protein